MAISLDFPVFPLQWTDPETGEISSGYRESGYFPEAVDNLLAFLGWNPGTERELFSLEEMVEAFSLERVGKSGSRFDPEKAKWYNQQYLKNHSTKTLALQVMPLLEKKGIKTDLNYVSRVVSLVRERMIFPQDLWEQAAYFFQAPETYDAQQQKKVWKNDTSALMGDAREILLNALEFRSASLESLVKKYVEEKEIGFGRVMAPLRLLVVGSGMGPHLFDIIEMIGKEETIRRIDRGVAALGSGNSSIQYSVIRIGGESRAVCSRQSGSMPVTSHQPSPVTYFIFRILISVPF